MLNHNSATERKETPHANKQTENKTLNLNGSSKKTISRSTKNRTLNLNGTVKATKSKTLNGSSKNTISNALKRRAQAVIKDRSIDRQSRALIRYGLETNDPWLAELLRRAEAGETIIDTVDFSQTPATSQDGQARKRLKH